MASANTVNTIAIRQAEGGAGSNALEKTKL